MAEEPKRKHSRHKKTLYVVVENCLIFKKSTANNILTHYTSKVLRSISDTNIKLHQQIAGYFEVTSNARNTFSRHYTQAVFNFIQFCSIRPLSMHQTTTSCWDNIWAAARAAASGLNTALHPKPEGKRSDDQMSEVAHWADTGGQLITGKMVLPLKTGPRPLLRPATATITAGSSTAEPSIFASSFIVSVVDLWADETCRSHEAPYFSQAALICLQWSRSLGEPMITDTLPERYSLAAMEFSISSTCSATHLKFFFKFCIASGVTSFKFR